MSIVTKSSLEQAQSKTLFAARRHIAAGMLGGALLFGGASLVEAAALPQHPCTPELQKLLSDWNTVGFEMPSKPSQATVYSRSGRVSSGPEVRYMASESSASHIGLPEWRCAVGACACCECKREAESAVVT